MDNQGVSGGSKNTNKAQGEVKFRTEKIGEWQARQKGFFAEQNQAEKDEKRAEASKRRKMLKFLVMGGGAILLVAIAIILLVIFWNNSQPVEEPPLEIGAESDGMVEYRDQLLQKFKDLDESEQTPDKIQEIVDKTLSTEEGRARADKVYVAQISALLNLGKYEEIVSIGKKVNVKTLNSSDRVGFYNAMGYAYAKLGDTAKTKEYRALAAQANREEFGGKGGK